MGTTVKAALLRAGWTGNMDLMIDKYEEAVRETAAQGA